MEILLASNNKNKHKELLKIFQEAGSKHTLKVNNDIPDVIEDKNTIEENAKYIFVSKNCWGRVWLTYLFRKNFI